MRHGAHSRRSGESPARPAPPPWLQVHDLVRGRGQRRNDVAGRAVPCRHLRLARIDHRTRPARAQAGAGDAPSRHPGFERPRPLRPRVARNRGGCAALPRRRFRRQVRLFAGGRRAARRARRDAPIGALQGGGLQNPARMGSDARPLPDDPRLGNRGRQRRHRRIRDMGRFQDRPPPERRPAVGGEIRNRHRRRSARRAGGRG